VIPQIDATTPQRHRNDATTTPQRHHNDTATTPRQRRDDAAMLVIGQLDGSEDSLVFVNLVRQQRKPCSLAELGWPSNMMCLHAQDANSHNSTSNDPTDMM
jgi:hypothetical protein